jgi:segregation and condensation protein A
MTDEYTVHLEQVFEGPMDLLLHLVREQEVEIKDVKIAGVVDGFFAYLEHLKDLDIEVAGDFLVMAATLMSIKSRSLLPREEVNLEDELDPQDELIQRLIEYRKFRGAADDLEDRYARRSMEHLRGFTGEARMFAPERELDMGELSIWDLLSSFSRLMRETLADRVHSISGNSHPLRWYVSMLANVLRDRRRLPLEEALFINGEPPTRASMIGGFCALLELVKIGLVTATQASQEDPIELLLCEDSEGDFEALIRSSQFMDEGPPDEFPDEKKNDGAPEGPRGIPPGASPADATNTPLTESELVDPAPDD